MNSITNENDSTTENITIVQCAFLEEWESDTDEGYWTDIEFDINDQPPWLQLIPHQAPKSPSQPESATSKQILEQDQKQHPDQTLTDLQQLTRIEAQNMTNVKRTSNSSLLTSPHLFHDRKEDELESMLLSEKLYDFAAPQPPMSNASSATLCIMEANLSEETNEVYGKRE